MNDHFLIQYVGAGGRLGPDASPPVDETALRRTLDFLAAARQSGRIPDLTLSLADATACWDALAAGRVQMAQVRATQYLAARGDDIAWAKYAATPTWDGRTVTVARGWMLAVVTRDPARQAVAADLILWLLRPDHAGGWTKAAGRLPTRRAALARWGDGDPYVAFARWQLEGAVSRPHTERFAVVSRSLQWAERQVLKGETTPERAVKTVLTEVAP